MKRGLIWLFLGVVLASSAIAVTPEKVWNVTWGLQNFLALPGAVEVDTNDNIIVVGTLDDGGISTRWAVIIKYDKNGNQLWNKTYSYNRSTWHDGVADANNNIIGAGFINNGTARWDYLAKFDSNGNELWNNSFQKTNEGGTYSGWNAVDVNANGEIIVAGANRTVSPRHTLLAKYDANGNQLWYQTFKQSASNQWEEGIDVKFDSNNNVWVLSDYRYSGMDYTLLLKYDANGNYLWNKTIGFADLEPNKMILDTDDNRYITGFDWNNFYPMLIKLDTNGNELWNVSYTGGNGPDFFGVALDLNDDIITVGEDINLDTWNMFGFMVKFDPTGSLIWNASEVIPGIDLIFEKVAINSENDIIANGYYDWGSGNDKIAINKYANGIPRFKKFKGVGDSTDLNFVSNTDSVSNLVLASTTSSIKWNGNVNVSRADLDSNINIGPQFVSLNLAQLSSSFNSSANVTFTSMNCNNFNLYHANGFYASSAALMAAGTVVATQNNVGGNCNDASICTNVRCSGGMVTFTAAHFDGFGGGGGNAVPEFSTYAMMLALVIVVGGFLFFRKGFSKI